MRLRASDSSVVCGTWLDWDVKFAPTGPRHAARMHCSENGNELETRNLFRSRILFAGGFLAGMGSAAAQSEVSPERSILKRSSCHPTVPDFESENCLDRSGQAGGAVLTRS